MRGLVLNVNRPRELMFFLQVVRVVRKYFLHEFCVKRYVLISSFSNKLRKRAEYKRAVAHCPLNYRTLEGGVRWSSIAFVSRAVCCEMGRSHGVNNRNVFGKSLNVEFLKKTFNVMRCLNTVNWT